MNWNYLETFIILAENLSFSQTARVLNTAQPVVSRQIQILESSMGSPLFIRNRKRVQLSETGLRLQRQLGPLVEEVKRVLSQEQGLQQGHQGIVRMGSMYEAGQLILFPRLKKILDENPGLQLHFTLMSSQSINEAIMAGSLDFGFVHQVNDRKAIESVVVTQDLPVMVSDWRMNKRWRESKEITVIGYRERDLYAESFIERNFLKSERRKFKFKMSVNSHSEMIDWLRTQADTVAVMPYSSIQRALDKEQIQILVRDKKPQDLFLICHHQMLIDRRKRALWERLQKSFV